MRCYRRLLHISYKDHITNEIVCTQIQTAIGPYEDLLTTVKKRKWRWFGHVTISSGLCKKKKGRQKKRWEDNIKELTGLDFNNSQRAAEDRQRWQKIVADVSSGAPTTLTVPGHRWQVKVCANARTHPHTHARTHTHPPVWCPSLSGLPT